MLLAMPLLVFNSLFVLMMCVECRAYMFGQGHGVAQKQYLPQRFSVDTAAKFAKCT